MRRKYFFISCLVILSTVFVLVYLTYPYILANITTFKKGISEKSTANLYISDNKIYIDFHISKKDKMAAKSLIQNLGISESILDGLSFSLDQNTTTELSQFLPVKLNLNINNNKLTFQKNGSVVLKSFITDQKYEIATGSAKGTMFFGNDRNFRIELIEPKPLLEFATASGKINLSRMIEPLFPILDKLGKIELSVRGDNIEGEIGLK